MSKLLKPLTTKEQKRMGPRHIALMPLAFCAQALEDATAIILADEEGRPLTYPDVLWDDDDPEGLIMDCRWTNDRDHCFEKEFWAAHNSDGGWVDIKTGRMWLRDTNDWLHEIILLNPCIPQPTGADLTYWAKALRKLVPDDQDVTEIPPLELKSAHTPA